jgi:hypothetical protein
MRATTRTYSAQSDYVRHKMKKIQGQIPEREIREERFLRREIFQRSRYVDAVVMGIVAVFSVICVVAVMIFAAW